MQPRSPEELPAIDDNIRRTVERTALRKARNLLDKIGAEEAAEKRARGFVFVISGILLLLAIFLVASLVR